MSNRTTTNLKVVSTVPTKVRQGYVASLVCVLLLAMDDLLRLRAAVPFNSVAYKKAWIAYCTARTEATRWLRSSEVADEQQLDALLARVQGFETRAQLLKTAVLRYADGLRDGGVLARSALAAYHGADDPGAEEVRALAQGDAAAASSRAPASEAAPMGKETERD